MKNKEGLLTELYEIQNLMGYMDEDFTGDIKPVVTEGVIDEGLANDISIEYDIEGLIKKIAREKGQQVAMVAIMISKLADNIKAKTSRPIKK